MTSKCFRTVLIATGICLTSCSSTAKGPSKGTAIGAGAGAATGAAIGAAAGGGKGAGIGAAAGGLAGAAIGTYLDQQEKELKEIVPTTRTESGLRIQLSNDILFPFDSTQLKADAKSTLDQLAEIFSKYTHDQFKIMGYTDFIGTQEYNQALSERRAKEVKQYLASQGVTSDRMEAIGRGESPNRATTPEGRKKNRRVDILITVPKRVA